MKISAANLPKEDSRGKRIRNPQSAIRKLSAFTLVEIAICLAIIGFAIVAIIGVLPMGMNTQRDNREETIINQDATVLLEAIRNGSRGADDLTNYVYAITNISQLYNDKGQQVGAPDIYGYTFVGASANGTAINLAITNGARIIGLLSTPEFTDANYGNFPSYSLPGVFQGGYSNHVVAYVRAMSGIAAEKPPQDNPIMREDTFSYRLLCVNAPISREVPPLWSAALTYSAGDTVTYLQNGHISYWTAVTAGTPAQPPSSADVPNSSVRWVRNMYRQELDDTQHELRLTFLWPQRPNGTLGNGRQTFRATIAGQAAQDQTYKYLYFYQPQSFLTNAP